MPILFAYPVSISATHLSELLHVFSWNQFPHEILFQVFASLASSHVGQNNRADVHFRLAFSRNRRWQWKAKLQRTPTRTTLRPFPPETSGLPQTPQGSRDDVTLFPLVGAYIRHFAHATLHRRRTTTPLQPHHYNELWSGGLRLQSKHATQLRHQRNIHDKLSYFVWFQIFA